MEVKKSLYELLKLPNQIRILIFSTATVLMLAPYVLISTSGVEISGITERAKDVLQIIGIPIFFAALISFLPWIKVKDRPQDIIEVCPINSSGQNIFAQRKDDKGRRTNKFIVRLNFKFWSKYSLEITNIDLKYDEYGMPGPQKIAIDTIKDEYEDLDGSYRMVNHKKLVAGSPTSIFVSRTFTGHEGVIADYRKATIDLEFYGSRWSGVNTVRISGDIATGGCWENLTYEMTS